MDPPAKKETIDHPSDRVVVRDDKKGVWQPAEKLLWGPRPVAESRSNGPHPRVDVGVLNQGLDGIVLEHDVVVGHDDVPAGTDFEPLVAGSGEKKVLAVEDRFDPVVGFGQLSDELGAGIGGAVIDDDELEGGAPGLDEESIVRPLDGIKVAIHYGCHLLKPSQIMHVDDADYPSILENLIRATGATPISHGQELLCCGKGCIDDDMPIDMVYDIFSSIRESGADCMGLICPTCFSSFDLGQIVVGRKKNTKFDIPVIYYFQLLGLAQGLTAEDVGLSLHKVKADRILERIGAA